MVDTRTATLERVSENLVELRFKPDVKLDVKGMSELVEAKRTLCAGNSMDVLAIMPSDLDFELSVLSFDHRTIPGGCGLAHRMAFATQSVFIERLTNIYFRYHPREHPTGVFVSETDARKWLAQKYPEPSTS